MISPFLVLPLALVAPVDEWMTPLPRVFASPSGSLGLKVVPTARFPYEAKATVFRLDRDGNPVRVWTAKMANMPVRAFISDEGHVATIDNWGGTGYDHAVVLYATNGKLLADYKRASLFEDKVMWENNVAMSVSSMHWADAADAGFEQRFEYRTVKAKNGTVTYGTPRGWQFVIRTKWGGGLRFDAATGKVVSKTVPKAK
jgi:hypothetical protein